MAETGKARRLSWLVKSCLPDPRRETAQPTSIKPPLQAVSTVVHGGRDPLICSLPDDLLLECLSRVPVSSLASLRLVCRRFQDLVDSQPFLDLRRSQGRLRLAIHALAVSDLGLLLTGAVTDASAATWAISAATIPHEIPDGSFSHARAVALGRSIYLIGRGATLRYDAWTGVVAPCAPTLFSRKKFAAAAVAGRIYVAGGAARTSAVEEYDPDTDTWRTVGDAPVRRYGCVGAATGGVFYLIGGLRVGVREELGRLDAHVCAGSMDAYDTVTKVWVRGGRAGVVPGGGCVVGACGAGPHVYVLASHAVEVSFWRWEAGRRRGGGAGEWARLEPPPLPGRLGLGGAVRFSCTAVGEDKVVALAHVSTGESGRRAAGASVEGAVLVYNIGEGEWKRGPDLPPGFRRAAFATVEC